MCCILASRFQSKWNYFLTSSHSLPSPYPWQKFVSTRTVAKYKTSSSHCSESQLSKVAHRQLKICRGFNSARNYSKRKLVSHRDRLLGITQEAFILSLSARQQGLEPPHWMMDISPKKTQSHNMIGYSLLRNTWKLLSEKAEMFIKIQRQ